MTPGQASLDPLRQRQRSARSNCWPARSRQAATPAGRHRHATGAYIAVSR